MVWVQSHQFGKRLDRCLYWCLIIFENENVKPCWILILSRIHHNSTNIHVTCHVCSTNLDMDIKTKIVLFVFDLESRILLDGHYSGVTVPTLDPAQRQNYQLINANLSLFDKIQALLSLRVVRRFIHHPRCNIGW